MDTELRAFKMGVLALITVFSLQVLAADDIDIGEPYFVTEREVYLFESSINQSKQVDLSSSAFKCEPIFGIFTGGENRSATAARCSNGKQKLFACRNNTTGEIAYDLHPPIKKESVRQILVELVKRRCAKP